MILLFLIFNIIIVHGQINSQPKAVVINSTIKTTRVDQDEKGSLNIDVNQNDLKRFKRQGFVRYSDMGAIVDGMSYDMMYIVLTHALANQYGYDVKADNGAIYAMR